MVVFSGSRGGGVAERGGQSEGDCGWRGGGWLLSVVQQLRIPGLLVLAQRV